MIASTQKMMITPLNQRSTYSFKNGNPIINFQIGRQDALVQGKSVYFNFKLNVVGPVGMVPGNLPLPGVTANTVVLMNERVGAWSIVDRLTISEASRNAQIEGIRDVGRVLAAVRPASVSPLDYNSTLNNKTLSATRHFITGNLLNNGSLDVSLRLADLSGFLDHGPIPLSQIPLNISLQLAPDAQVLQVDPAHTGSQMTYSISDVTLTGDLLIPDADMARKMAAQDEMAITFDSYTNVYNVQNSTNQTTSLQLGLGAVKSVFTTLLPPDHQNNITVDSFDTPNFATGQPNEDSTIDRVSFLRGSQNFPIVNELEVKEVSAADNPLTPVIKHGLRSIGRWNARLVRNTLMSPSTQCNVQSDVGFEGVPFSILSDISCTERDPLQIYGCDMDSYSGAGLDFRGTTAGLRINMDETTPTGLHSTAIARHTLIAKGQQITVVS
tara:strand:- start:2106 stop:3425 length:1320 start_codon:yes stop_codon:yes gene_type:complete